MDSNYALGVTLVISVLIAASTTAVPTSAHPPNSTDHGVPAETFHKLWAGDRDGSVDGGDLSNGSSIEQLSNSTDIPFDSPPRGVEQWNRGDHGEFPTTNSDVSIHPPDADLTDERFIKNAYSEVFAVQPSTRARLSSSRQPLYLAPNGTLRGTVDYRVAVPPDDTTGDRRVYWRLERHRIANTTLLVDGDEAGSTDGSHAPALSYALDGYAGKNHQLTLQSTISVRLRKRVEVCTAHDDEGDCTNWRSSVSYPTENATVADTIEGTQYDLAVSGFIARYPNSELGLVVYKNQPWLGYDVPNGDVRGVWRFYSARDTDWDRLIYSEETGHRTVASPLHPLQVNAYPIETGPTPSPRRNVTILDVYGTPTEPPRLPSTVQLDVLTEPYTASYGIATRARTDAQPTPIRAWGLVDGVTAERPPEEFARIPIQESNLTLAVVNQTVDTATVRVTLRNANTSAAIDTVDRDGYVSINGQRVNTSDTGTVTTTVERTPGGVSARYEPGHWWRNTPGYTGDSDTVRLDGPVLQLVSALFRLGVPVSLFLLAVFLIDRITGWRVWPPWRSL